MHRNRRGGGVMHRIPAFPSRVWTPFGAVTIHNFYTAMPPVQCPYSAHTVPVQCPYSARDSARWQKPQFLRFMIKN